MRTALTIAGRISGGGAGILTDFTPMAAHGVYAKKQYGTENYIMDPAMAEKTLSADGYSELTHTAIVRRIMK